MNKINSLIQRIKKGEFRYLFKRFFPGGNPVFYTGKQMLFKLSNIKRFESLFAMTRQRCSHQFLLADQLLIDRLKKEFPHKATRFTRRINAGDQCYVTLKDDDISGYAWIREADVYDTNSLWRYRPQERDAFWAFDMYIKPQYRLQGVFIFLEGSLYELYKQKGYTSILGETPYTNEKALKSNMRNGFEVICEVRYISILGLKIYIENWLKENRKSLSFRYAIFANRYRL